MKIPQTGMTKPVPAAYTAPSEHPGTVVQVGYDSQDYLRGDAPVSKTAWVYLPYGYDENDTETRYDILYLMHGWGGAAGEYFYMGDGMIKNMLDHMIENGEIRPVIAVSATFYNETSDRDFGASEDALRVFHRDFTDHLMPAVEGTFHSYADSTSPEDLAASRDHRAFGGFSLGSVTTWMEFCHDTDYIRYLLDALNNLIRCLEIYLGEYVQSLPISQLKDIEELQIDKILSFNYTNTAERLYAQKDGKPLDYDYIHGKANVHHSPEECNLVLGIDEYLPAGKQDSDNEYIEFKKFYQRIYKATGSHYIDWVDQYRENRQRFRKGPVSQMNVYIYGHSLDVTDKDILRNLILEEGTITTVYYYNKNDLGKKIANLVKVIGEAELIKRTDGRRATIIFRETAK